VYQLYILVLNISFGLCIEKIPFQGTWAFAEKDAPFWYKAVITGNTL